VYTTVTTQRYLKYALRAFDDQKAYYDVVSIRTEITTDIKYVTSIEQNPPDVSGGMAHSSTAEPSFSHIPTYHFSIDGQEIPYNLCLPTHPDVGDDNSEI
jgi:hypothetical protein